MCHHPPCPSSRMPPHLLPETGLASSKERQEDPPPFRPWEVNKESASRKRISWSSQKARYLQSLSTFPHLATSGRKHAMKTLLKNNPSEWLLVTTALRNQATGCKGPLSKHLGLCPPLFQRLHFRSPKAVHLPNTCDNVIFGRSYVKSEGKQGHLWFQMDDLDDALSPPYGKILRQLEKKLQRELDTKIQDQGTRFHLQLIYVIFLKNHKRIPPKMWFVPQLHRC